MLDSSGVVQSLTPKKLRNEVAAEGKVFASSIQKVSEMGMIDTVLKCENYLCKRLF